MKLKLTNTYITENGAFVKPVSFDVMDADMLADVMIGHLRIMGRVYVKNRPKPTVMYMLGGAVLFSTLYEYIQPEELSANEKVMYYDPSLAIWMPGVFHRLQSKNSLIVQEQNGMYGSYTRCRRPTLSECELFKV